MQRRKVRGHLSLWPEGVRKLLTCTRGRSQVTTDLAALHSFHIGRTSWNHWIKSKHGKGGQGKFMETQRNDGLQQRLRQNKDLEMLLFTNTCLRAIPKDNHGMFLEFRIIRERRWKELETSTIKNKFFHRKPVKLSFPTAPHSDAATVRNHHFVPRRCLFKTLRLLGSPCWPSLKLSSYAATYEALPSSWSRESHFLLQTPRALFSRPLQHISAG